MFGKYIKTWVLGISTAMEYRVNFILSLISSVFPIIIQVFLWTAIFNSSDSSMVYGYTYEQMITYTLLGVSVSKFVYAGFEMEINNDIKMGGLNKYIIRPISYFPFRLFTFLGEKTFSLLLFSIFITGIIFILPQFVDITFLPSNVFLFVIVLFFAVILNFTIFFVVAMLAFWLHEVSRFFSTIQIVTIVIGGGIFPIDVFGDKLYHFLLLLPFQYTTYFPVNILNGRMAYNEIMNGLVMQMIWILMLGGLSILLWNRGLKKYVAVGG